MSHLSIIKSGVQMSLQDLGRYGHTQQGISQGGALDLHAHCWANKLLENNPNCATVEIVIGMAEFRAESDMMLAITGADMQATIDGELIGNWCSFFLKKGQTLKLKAAQSGMRSYLAAKGGFQIEPSLGSVSTVVRNSLGGRNGKLLEQGDQLPVLSPKQQPNKSLPSRYIPEYSPEITLRVIESYQADLFSAEAKNTLYQSQYTLDANSDRMGARLSGEVIDIQANLISEGIALGSIQIPANGQPIILLNDRQTLGGYPKIGCVAKVDLPKLAQARPGTIIHFQPISLKEAGKEWREFREFFG